MFIAGDHAPVNPSFEVKGRVKEDPMQIGAMALKVGATGAPTLTVIVAVFAH